ncbi:MAG TPA: hypothetical protein VKD71_04700 [Gemmataceae bacterium]|nr:hypothetical protein [Gemmataceae bacterium]
MRALAAFFLFAVPTFIVAQDLPHFGDAALRSIQFVDENEGWAAGDDGVVWHTIDGGKSWERQPTGARASLRCVHFLTPYSGWAVGRVELPGGGSSGVVLATSDGGLKWKLVNSSSVPGLNVVKFFGERVGIAAGDGSETYPSGLFTTMDGGRTWKPMPGTRNPSWLCGDFTDTQTGVLGGAWSRLAAVREGAMGPADVDSLAGRNVKGLKVNGDRAVAVGQGGLVMVSQNTAGVRWGFPDLKLPHAMRAAIDFHAVAVHGSHVWAVGRPGSMVFHSADHGMTWEILKTGQPLPLHAVCFVDEKRGWACGEMGTILGTFDGGKTWVVQRQGGMRSAILFVHSEAKCIPLDTVAALGGEDGYYAVGLGVTCADPATLTRRYDTDAERIAAAMKAADPLRATDPERVAQVLRMAGGAAGEVMWQFPVAEFQEGTEAQALLDAWEKRHGEKAAVAMLRQLVFALRVWRPDVIVTGAPADETAKTLNVVVRKAFEVAADPEAFPEQIKDLGLSAWAGRKLLVGLDKADSTCVKVDVATPLPHLGDSAKEYATPACRVLGQEKSAAGFRLVATRLKDADGQVKVFDGISLAPGGSARREQAPVTEKDEAARVELLKAHEKKRTVQAMIDGRAGPLASPDQALAQIGDAINDLPAMDAGNALFTAATAYANTGQWSMAREAYFLLLDKYPGHPLTLDAARWLVRFQASSEARHRYELGQFVQLTEAQVAIKERTDPRATIPKAKTKDKLPPESEVIQATYRQPVAGVVSARKWYEAALDMESRLAAHGDLFARDVPTNLCLASARRNLGRAEESQRWLLRYITETTVPLGAPTGARGADPWRECVLLESWLINRAGQPQSPKPVAACRRTVKRPYLDGKLDDDCWQDAIPMLLSTTAGDLGRDFGCREAIEREFKDNAGKTDPAAVQQALANGTRAAFAFDDEYLYIAIVCRHPAGMKKEKVAARGRDMDLRAHDRVSILIDLDRDYQTYYQLQIDQRGALAEDCWGDRSWNPKWFVAVNAEETGWTAEAAIPLAELTGDVITPGKLWAVNVVRTVPGKGVQAWSGPAGVTPRPEGMGILTFMVDPKK